MNDSRSGGSCSTKAVKPICLWARRRYGSWRCIVSHLRRSILNHPYPGPPGLFTPRILTVGQPREAGVTPTQFSSVEGAAQCRAYLVLNFTGGQRAPAPRQGNRWALHRSPELGARRPGHGRSSKTRLNGVSLARRKRLNPACSATFLSCPSEASVPSAVCPDAIAFGVQHKTDAPE